MRRQRLTGELAESEAGKRVPEHHDVVELQYE